VRDAFIRTLTELAPQHREVILLSGDLGFAVLDDYIDRFPRQFLNVGIAEQNMSGLAAGMALEGHTVFTYSIGGFPTLRCLEQIRNDICYHGANVKIVCVGGGMSYGPVGFSHHATGIWQYFDRSLACRCSRLAISGKLPKPPGISSRIAAPPTSASTSRPRPRLCNLARLFGRAASEPFVRDRM